MPGLLDSLGLNIDPEAMARENLQQRQALSLGLVNKMGFSNPADQGGANIGALLGARMGGPAPLTQDQQRKVATQQEAAQRMQEWVKTNAEVDDNTKSEKYQTFLAEAAFRNGLSDVGAQVLHSVDQAQRARKVQDLELEKVGLAIDRGKQEIEQSAGFGKTANIWMQGERNPAKGQLVWISDGSDGRPKGSVTLPTGQVLQLGEYTTNEPPDPNSYGGGAGGYGATKTELGKIRAMGLALKDRGAVMRDMRPLMDSMFANTGTLAGTGRAGEFTSWANRFANDISGIASAFGAGSVTVKGRGDMEYSIDTAAGRARLAKEYGDVFKEAMPAKFKTNAALADQYVALMSSLTFADARSFEGAGGRSLSDADVKAAAKRVGAALNDPNSIRDILMGSYRRAVEQLGFNINMLPEGDRRLAISPEALRALDEQNAAIEAQWAEPFAPGADAAPAAKTVPPAGTTRKVGDVVYVSDGKGWKKQK